MISTVTASKKAVQKGEGTAMCKCKKACEKWNQIVAYVKEEEFSKREMVMAVITFFLAGLVIGVFISPKGRKVIGSHNGCNNGNNNADSGIVDSGVKDCMEDKKGKKGGCRK